MVAANPRRDREARREAREDLSPDERRVRRERRALREATCPKDGGRIIEVSMPDVVCEKCSTRYTFAFSKDQGEVHWKLIEGQGAIGGVSAPQIIQREIVKVPCKYCGNLNDLATTRVCPSCGAPVR